MAEEDPPGSTSASIAAGWPGRIWASWLSLKLASIHKPRAGTRDISWAPTLAKAPVRALRLPTMPSIGARISV